MTRSPTAKTTGTPPAHQGEDQIVRHRGRPLLRGRNLRLVLWAYFFLQAMASLASWNFAIRSAGLQVAWVGAPPIFEIHHRYLEGRFETAFEPFQTLFGLAHHTGFVFALLALRKRNGTEKRIQSLAFFGLWLYYGLCIFWAGLFAVMGAVEMLGFL